MRPDQRHGRGPEPHPPRLAVEEGDDLIVHGDPALAGTRASVEIRTFDDHRIAMSFALAGLLVGGVAILDPLCVGKTYPGYWDDLAKLGVGMMWASGEVA